MSLNLQKELLEFQNELKELNSYSIEIKRMEKGLSEAEAIARVATKAAETISSRYAEHLLQLQKELNVYLLTGASDNKQLLNESVTQLTQQIRSDVERIGPLVNNLESGISANLYAYEDALKKVREIEQSLGSKLTDHIAALQAQNKETSEAISTNVLSLQSKHTGSVTELLQEKTSLLIKAGEELQLQSKQQGQELIKVLGELNNASAFLAEVSETISKSDFSAKLQQVEKALTSINSNILTLEETLNNKSLEIEGSIASNYREVSTSLKNGFDDLLYSINEQSQLAAKEFEKLNEGIAQLEQVLAATEVKFLENFTFTNQSIKRIDEELNQRFMKLNNQQEYQFKDLQKQIKLLRLLLIGGISFSGLIGLLWIAKTFL